jgi:hypothetical protein
MYCCWKPMPTVTSAGGCSSHPCATLGMIHDTCGSSPFLTSLKNLAVRRERTLVVLVLVPEQEDVVGVAERDAVEAVVVDLPAHAVVVQQIQVHRMVEDPEAPTRRSS